jgi:Mrp family chromosome partitioning ATPase
MTRTSRHAPVLAVTDAAVLAPRADGVILVVKSERRAST